jgi:hypothetical protein
MGTSGRKVRFAIDADNVAVYRAQLKAMTHGTPIAEAAIDGFSDWQVVEAMERMWSVATDIDQEAADDQSTHEAPDPGLIR